MNQEAFLNELGRQFETNIESITNNFRRLLTMQNSPSDVVQFFDWFSKWSNQSINRQGNPEYPLWLTELTKLSKPMRKPSYAEGPLAKAAIIVYDLIKDISYCGTEEHHVEKTLDILQLLKSVPDGTEQKTR